MRIIFFGTSDLAAKVLKKLLSAKHKILLVVTAPDKKKGRGQKLAFSPVKSAAQNKGLFCLQPQDFKDRQFIKNLKDKSAGLFVVCAYGKILSKGILQIPRICAINLHASLLPKYRGAAPINWAILKGERETGVTVFKMDEHMDRGEIILQKRVEICANDTTITLAEKIAEEGTLILLKAIDLLENGRVVFKPQDEQRASLAPKLKKEDGRIDWRKPASEINNMVRGLQPWPGAFTYLHNKLLKIWQGAVIKEKEKAAYGQILQVDSKKGILVQTGRNKFLITVLQLEGKKIMPATEFILGHKVKVGERLGFKLERGGTIWLG